MTEHDSYRVLARRTMLFVRDWPGAGPPVLFLHHLTANSLLALHLGRLLDQRRHLIAPDLRGRGHSDMPFGEYGVQMHLQELTALLARLNIHEFVAAGHSFGAALSLFLAAQFPERVTGLILFDGGAPLNPTAATMLQAYYANLQYRYPSLEAYVEQFKTNPTYQPWTEVMDILVRSNLDQQPDGTYIRHVPRYVVEAEQKPEHLAALQRLPELYPQVKCPVLILRAGMGLIGKADQVLTDEITAHMTAGFSSAPSVVVETIEEAGHTSLMTIPSRQRDEAILKFLGVA